MVNKICCIGAGYVGGPYMAVMALKCPAIEVAVLDVSRARIDAWNSDRLPIFEPGLDAVVKACRGRNISFSTDVERHVTDADIVSVNTPTKSRGLGAGKAADFTYWESAARVAAGASRSDKIIVEKSTVPVKTAEAMERILSSAHNNGSGVAFQVLSNPEFFAEGTAVRDLLCPDRVLIGGRGDTADGKNAVRALRDVYAHWVPEDRIVTTSLWSTELSELAANAFLAQRVSSVNVISAVYGATGAAQSGRDSHFAKTTASIRSGTARPPYIFGPSLPPRDIVRYQSLPLARPFAIAASVLSPSHPASRSSSTRPPGRQPATADPPVTRPLRRRRSTRELPRLGWSLHDFSVAGRGIVV